MDKLGIDLNGNTGIPKDRGIFILQKIFKTINVDKKIEIQNDKQDSRLTKD